MTDRRVEEKNHYDHRYFHEPEKSGKIAKIFDLVNANATEFFYKQVFNCKNHKSSGKILDYGCGTGVKSASLAENGLKIVENYGWKRVAQSYSEEIYRELLS